MADWQHTAQNAALQDLDIDLYRPDGSLYLSTTLLLGLTEGPNQYSSLFTNQPNERINVVAPVAGAWRAVIKGNVSVSETVHGLWSTVYPDGTALSPAPAPYSVTVTAPAPAVAGQPVTLTAIVRDAAGASVPNAPVSWGSTGVGTIATHEPFTDERGMALATARSAVPGAQTATARAGSASGAASVDWLGVSLPPPPSYPPPPANTPGKASGGGNFMHPNKRHFAFSAEYAASASSPGGALAYDDKIGTRVTGDGVDSFVVSGGNRATIKGPASVNGLAGYRYALTVVDNGEPGRNDTISLKVARTGYSYETGGTLSGGNLQVEAY
ncbi:MAG TPA: Ig-like domain-containing protein [Verrucomicrobiae bacterium]|nr:Ig-like domain-containing protein [Verrucomicrobiae bacterium]